MFLSSAIDKGNLISFFALGCAMQRILIEFSKKKGQEQILLTYLNFAYLLLLL